MCGPAHLSSDVSEIKIAFRIPPERPTSNIAPSWNVAPTDTLPVVRFDLKAGQRSLDMLRWGLIRSWAKDIKVGFANINSGTFAETWGNGRDAPIPVIAGGKAPPQTVNRCSRAMRLSRLAR
jgi:putative SOS response-associated peptidase YedK